MRYASLLYPILLAVMIVSTLVLAVALVVLVMQIAVAATVGILLGYIHEHTPLNTDTRVK